MQLLAWLLPGGAWHRLVLNPSAARSQDLMEGVQRDEIWCRRMACVEQALGTQVARPKRTKGCPLHLLLAWPFLLEEWLWWAAMNTTAAPPAACQSQCMGNDPVEGRLAALTRALKRQHLKQTLQNCGKKSSPSDICQGPEKQILVMCLGCLHYKSPFPDFT